MFFLLLIISLRETRMRVSELIVAETGLRGTISRTAQQCTKATGWRMMLTVVSKYLLHPQQVPIRPKHCLLQKMPLPLGKPLFRQKLNPPVLKTYCESHTFLMLSRASCFMSQQFPLKSDLTDQMGRFLSQISASVHYSPPGRFKCMHIWESIWEQSL